VRRASEWRWRWWKAKTIRSTTKITATVSSINAVCRLFRSLDTNTVQNCAEGSTKNTTDFLRVRYQADWLRAAATCLVK
jgi:hypothetical protein